MPPPWSKKFKCCILCTMCGKRYVDPVAAQNHSIWNHAGVRQCLSVSAMNTAKRHNKGRPHVRGRWLECPRCPAAMAWNPMKQHLTSVHGVIPRKRLMKSLHKTNAKPTNDKEPTTSDYPSTRGFDDEEQILVEDEGSISFDGEEHVSLEDAPPEGKAKELMKDNQQYFSCNSCPESFLTAETLMMHTKFAHCWTCGYCRNLPMFSSVSLWREHRVTVHGLVGWSRATHLLRS